MQSKLTAAVEQHATVNLQPFELDFVTPKRLFHIIQHYASIAHVSLDSEHWWTVNL